MINKTDLLKSEKFIHENVTYARYLTGLRSQDYAFNIGITPQLLNKIECGFELPKDDVLERITKESGVLKSFFFKPIKIMPMECVNMKSIFKCQ